MSNIDDWLSSLGFEDTSLENTHSEEQPEELTVTDAPLPTILSDVVLPEVVEESPIQQLSEQDYNDILSDIGFNEMQEAEIVENDDEDEEEDEEEEEENTEEYNEDNVGNMDLNIQEEVVQEPQEESPVPSEPEPTLPASAPLIQPNSPTLLMNDATSRFSGTEWYNEIQKQKVLIAGCGGIGSNLAFQVARMHPAALFLYDNDVVERANMSGQLFSHNDVGKSKVDAVANKINTFTTTEHVYAISDRFTATSDSADIMMSGFDNMEARRIFFTSWYNHVSSKPEEERRKCLYLDGRLSIDTLQIFCITGDDTYNMQRYQKDFLFSDREAEETICSMKQTTYMACMIGSLMTNLFTNFVAGLLDPIIPYDLPFFTEYDAQNMIFKTEK